jgi:hypothetical protein
MNCVKHINYSELRLTNRLLPVSGNPLLGRLLYFIKLNTLIIIYEKNNCF